MAAGRGSIAEYRTLRTTTTPVNDFGSWVLAAQYRATLATKTISGFTLGDVEARPPLLRAVAQFNWEV